MQADLVCLIGDQSNSWQPRLHLPCAAGSFGPMEVRLLGTSHEGRLGSPPLTKPVLTPSSSEDARRHLLEPHKEHTPAAKTSAVLIRNRPSVPYANPGSLAAIEAPTRASASMMLHILRNALQEGPDNLTRTAVPQPGSERIPWLERYTPPDAACPVGVHRPSPSRRPGVPAPSAGPLRVLRYRPAARPYHRAED